ncbi:hypothetical protein F5Y15DRAFT_427779 [Xylariaceae sp. FL0016]|nr:hypothetical protein F5Y15DRAFT_427779 [Xylariaceae sp. FL0016]
MDIPPPSSFAGASQLVAPILSRPPSSLQQVAQPQYTTVGSIYKSQHQPLQPPARRGRAVKNLNNSAKNELPTPVHHYSPLQQNFDRAISPTYHHLSNPSDQSNDVFGPYHSSMSGMPLSNTFTLPNAVATPAASEKNVNTNIAPLRFGTDNDNEEDHGQDQAQGDDNTDDDGNALNGMNFKTLANLASYPNPSQKAAQKALASHRPLATPVNILTSPRHSPICSQKSHAAMVQKAPAAGLRTARSEPVTMGGLLQSDRIDEYGDHKKPSHLQPEAISWVQTTRGSNYSVLSKGPGAPAPLTAGPPGVRKLKTFSLESTSNAFHNSLRKHAEFDDDISVPNPYNFRLQFVSSQQQRGLTTNNPPPTPSLKSDIGTAHILNPIPKSVTKVYDTRTEDEVRKFYPDGLPSNFDRSGTLSLPHDWTHEYPRHDQFLKQQRPEFWAARKTKIDADFYQGNDRIDKPFQQAVAEKNRRGVASAIGQALNEPPRREGKVINRKITVEDVCNTPTHVHAAPLLSLLLQAMASRPEFCRSTTLPRCKDKFTILS